MAVVSGTVQIDFRPCQSLKTLFVSIYTKFYVKMATESSYLPQRGISSDIVLEGWPLCRVCKARTHFECLVVVEEAAVF